MKTNLRDAKLMEHFFHPKKPFPVIFFQRVDRLALNTNKISTRRCERGKKVKINVALTQFSKLLRDQTFT